MTRELVTRQREKSRISAARIRIELLLRKKERKKDRKKLEILTYTQTFELGMNEPSERGFKYIYIERES